VFKNIAFITIGILIGIIASIATANAQQLASWMYVPDQQTSIYQQRDLNSAVVARVPAGSPITIFGAYVQSNDMIWGESVTGFVPVARYGYCDILNFGTYDPPRMAPISGIDTRNPPVDFNREDN